jgi:hypothetical protein
MTRPGEAIFGPAAIPDPYPAYAQLREQVPVTLVVFPNGQTVWMVTRYDEACAALQDDRLGKDLRPCGTCCARPEPCTSPRRPTRSTRTCSPPTRRNTRLRRPVSREFSPRRVSELRPYVASVVDHLLDAVAGSERCDLIGTFAYGPDRQRGRLPAAPSRPTVIVTPTSGPHRRRCGGTPGLRDIGHARDTAHRAVRHRAWWHADPRGEHGHRRAWRGQPGPAALRAPLPPRHHPRQQTSTCHSAGVRTTAGAVMSRMIIATAISKLLARLPELALAVAAEDLAWQDPRARSAGGSSLCPYCCGGMRRHWGTRSRTPRGHPPTPSMTLALRRVRVECCPGHGRRVRQPLVWSLPPRQESGRPRLPPTALPRHRVPRDP